MISHRLFAKLVCAFITASVSAQTGLIAQSPSFVSFDAPDAGKSANEGTYPVGVNQSGVVVGSYADSQGLGHGFIRFGNGQITEFDPPGMNNTFATAINSRGQAVGYANHPNGGGQYTVHGFLRNPNGKFVAIDVPGAVGTLPGALNDSGTIAGTYEDGSIRRSFIRDSTGHYTIYDCPDGVEGTWGTAINSSGEITGFCDDANFQLHGFVRDPLGNITEFDAPGTETVGISVNSNGSVVGIYNDASDLEHSFLRDAAGDITTIDMPGANRTYPLSVNDQGLIVGEVLNIQSDFVGYRRDSAGNFRVISAPAPNSGTDAVSVNNASQVTGYYLDRNSLAHGFIQ